MLLRIRMPSFYVHFTCNCKINCILSSCSADFKAPFVPDPDRKNWALIAARPRPIAHPRDSRLENRDWRQPVLCAMVLQIECQFSTHFTEHLNWFAGIGIRMGTGTTEQHSRSKSKSNGEWTIDSWRTCVCALFVWLNRRTSVFDGFGDKPTTLCPNPIPDLPSGFVFSGFITAA